MKIQKIPFEDQMVSDSLIPSWSPLTVAEQIYRRRSRCRTRSSTSNRSTLVPNTPSATASPASSPPRTTPSPSQTT